MSDLARPGTTLEAVDLRPGLAADEVTLRLAKGARLNETGQRILAYYLLEMHDRGLHQVTGHSSTAKYAEERLDIDPRRTRELISVGRKLLTLPATDAAFCEGRLGWSKVLELVKVAVPEHEAEWVVRAHRSTVRELALETKIVPAGRPPRKPGQTKGLPEVRFRVGASVNVLTWKKLELAKEKLSAERGEQVGDSELLDELAEMFLAMEQDGSVPGRTRVSSSLYRIVLRSGEDDQGLLAETEHGPVPIDGGEDDGALARVRSDCIRCDGEHVDVEAVDVEAVDVEAVQAEDEQGKCVDPIQRDVTTPPALRRRVLVRDENRCRCCGSTRRLMVHHIRYRSHGGATRAWNLIALCVRCHALVHAHLLVLKGKRSSRIRFLDAAGRPLKRGPGHVDPRVLMPLLQTSAKSEDETVLRPPPAPQSVERAFAGVVGQEALLSRLADTIRGCRALERPFPHLLFTGPPGTGKTTLSRGIAACFGARLVETMGPLLQDGAALTHVVGRLQRGEMLFIDEIHAVPRTVLESLYDALSGNAFTLLAATTEAGELPLALHSRFGLRESLEFYSVEDLAVLARAKAEGHGFEVDMAGARQLAECARGTPRELLRLVDRLIEWGAGAGRRRLGREDAEGVLERLGFDSEGLDPTEQRYLSLLRGSRQPVPLGRLARMLGTSARTLLEHVEPFLFRLGLVEMSERGRKAADVRRPGGPIGMPDRAVI